MIGIFDSGIGGLTVVKEISKRLPVYDLVYFGDTARVPYGNKSTELIKKYAREDADFLLNKGASLIVVACNTVSAVALDHLRSELSVPVFGVIEPAVRAALESTRSGKVGMIGTRATINSGVFSRSLLALRQAKQSVDNDVKVPAYLRKGRGQKNAEVNLPDIKFYSQAAPLLVPLAEEGYVDRPEAIKILKHYLQPLKLKQIDTLILGCTHYPLFKDIIVRKLNQVKVIDSATYVAKELGDFIAANPEIERNLSKRRQSRFFVSDLTPQLQEVAQRFLGKRINLEQVSFD